MSEVRIEVMPMLATSFGAPGAERLLLTEPIEAGESLRRLLNRLVGRHAGLEGIVFDTREQQLTDFVRVIVNGQMVELGCGLETVLEDQDEVLFLPAFAGG